MQACVHAIPCTGVQAPDSPPGKVTYHLLRTAFLTLLLDAAQDFNFFMNCDFIFFVVEYQN